MRELIRYLFKTVAKEGGGLDYVGHSLKNVLPIAEKHAYGGRLLSVWQRVDNPDEILWMWEYPDQECLEKSLESVMQDQDYQRHLRHAEQALIEHSGVAFRLLHPINRS